MYFLTAFLHGEVEEDIFMEQAEGFVDGSISDYFCKLIKAIYGLNQAPRQWFPKMVNFLVNNLGFEKNSADPCLYLKGSPNGNLMVISLYFEDLLLAGNYIKSITWIKTERNRQFEMKDLGEAKNYSWFVYTP